MEGASCEIKVPVTEEGALYGSVGTREIADAFVAIDINIDKSEVQLPDGPIKEQGDHTIFICLLYTSPSPRDGLLSRMPSSA